MKLSIKFYARCFEVLCMVLIPIIYIAPVLMWFFGDKLLDSSYGIKLADFSLMKRLLIIGVATVGNSIFVYGLCIFIKIMRLFQNNEIFSTRTAGLFQRVSNIILVWGLSQIVISILFHKIVLPTMPIMLRCSLIGSSILMYFFVYVFIDIFSRLIFEATQLKKDQDLTV